MIIAYGDTWTLRAHSRIRTLAVTNGSEKEEKLQFKLDDDDLYLFCDDVPRKIDNKMLYNVLDEVLTRIADTDNIDDTINDIMIALL